MFIISYLVPILIYFVVYAILNYFFGHKISESAIKLLSFLTLGIYALSLWLYLSRNTRATDDISFEDFKFKKVVSYVGINSYGDSVRKKYLVYDLKLVNNLKDISEFSVQPTLEYKNVNKTENILDIYSSINIALDTVFDKFETFKKGDTINGFFSIELDSIKSIGKEKTVLYWIAHDIPFETEVKFYIRGKQEGGDYVLNQIDYELDLSDLPKIVKDAWRGVNNIFMKSEDDSPILLSK
jgi:hypothetical protein